jgi:hypothetical protein
MECIICQDTGSENLQENTLCPCKYKYHSKCWVEYIHSKTNNITCLLCRKDLNLQISLTPQDTIYTPLIQPSAPPYSPQEHNSHQISYQEFVEIIRQHNLSENTIIDIRPSIQISQQIHNSNLVTSRKIIKVVIGLSIISIIIAIFFILMKML